MALVLLINSPTTENGKMIRCTGKERLTGKMGALMQETFNVMRNMDMAFTNGPMVENIMVNGRRANNMAKEITYLQMAYEKKVYGKMANE